MDVDFAGFEVDVLDGEAGGFGDAQAGVEEEVDDGGIAFGVMTGHAVGGTVVGVDVFGFAVGGFDEGADFLLGEGKDVGFSFLGWGFDVEVRAGDIEFVSKPAEEEMQVFEVGADGFGGTA